MLRGDRVRIQLEVLCIHIINHGGLNQDWICLDACLDGGTDILIIYQQRVAASLVILSDECSTAFRRVSTGLESTAAKPTD